MVDLVKLLIRGVLDLFNIYDVNMFIIEVVNGFERPKNLSMIKKDSMIFYCKP